MQMENNSLSRTVKTAWFSKAARKAHISDSDLCKAVQQVMQGQADDLGGGVFKKRLNDNRYRSIILAKGGRYWIYAYLFAKKDRDNIDINELTELRKLANLYSRQTDDIIEIEIKNGDLLEICNAKE